MDPELERLAAALKAAHAAGDTAAATKLATALRERQSSGGQPAMSPEQTALKSKITEYNDAVNRGDQGHAAALYEELNRLDPERMKGAKQEAPNDFGSRFSRGWDALWSGKVDPGRAAEAVALGPAAIFNPNVTPENFNRGLGVIANDPGKAAQIGENVIRNMTAPVGGDYAAAAGSFVSGKGFNPDEQRARREQLTSQYGGEEAQLAGYLAGGRVLADRVAPVAGNVITALPGGARAAAAVEALPAWAQSYAGTGALAASETLLGGVAKGDSLEEAAQDAAGAAIAGPLLRGGVEGVTRGGVAVADFVKNILPLNKTQTAIREIAKRTEMSPADVEQAYIDWITARGSVPTTADIVDDITARRLGNVAANRTGAGSVTVPAAAARTDARPQQLSEDIQGNRPPRSVERERQLLEEQTTRHMEPIRNDTVRLYRMAPGQPAITGPGYQAPTQAWNQAANNLNDLLTEPRVEALLPRELRVRIRDGLANDTLTVNDIERVRQLVSRAGQQNVTAAEAFNFREFNRSLRDAMEQLHPNYSQVLSNYERYADFIGGIEEGATIRTANTQDVTQAWPQRQAAGKETPFAAPGRAEGARQALADAAQKDSATAARIAEEVQAPALQQRLAATVGPDEAARLNDIGRMESQSIRNYDTLSRAPEGAFPTYRDFRLVLDAGTLGTGRGSQAFVNNVIGNIARYMTGLGMSPGVGRRMAELIVDPAQTQMVIDRMRQIGVQDAQINEMFRQVTAAMQAQASNDQ